MFAPTSAPAPVPTASGGTLARLRAATRAHHERAEARNPVLDPALDLAGYRRALAALHAFHAAVERALAAVPGLDAVVPELEARWKAPLLARDLAALGVLPNATPDATLNATPDAAPGAAPSVTWIDGLPAALGTCYVLEGATLGGQLVARRLRETLGVAPEAGGAFYAAYGEAIGPRWRAFGRAVDAWGERHPADVPRALAAAGDTFDALGDWLAAAGGAALGGAPLGGAPSGGAPAGGTPAEGRA